MIRLTGILAGSALAISAIILLFGVPELVRSVDVSAVVPVAPPATEAPMPGVVSDMIEEEPPGLVAVTDSPSPDNDVEVVDRAFNDATNNEPDILVETVDEPEDEPMSAPVSAAESQYWYAFWSPFRSELAADGFIAELQRTTGLDYRVVKLKPGVYEVAFAYSDDTDRQDKIERISAATGLDMSGG